MIPCTRRLVSPVCMRIKARTCDRLRCRITRTSSLSRPLCRQSPMSCASYTEDYAWNTTLAYPCKNSAKICTPLHRPMRVPPASCRRSDLCAVACMSFIMVKPRVLCVRFSFVSAIQKRVLKRRHGTGRRGWSSGARNMAPKHQRDTRRDARTR